jgi:serine/threonine-protein kinase
VTDRAELKATFDERWQALGIAETAPLVALDATVTPRTLRMNAAQHQTPEGWTRPQPGDLPRISVSFAGAPPPASESLLRRTDLEVRDILGEGGMGRVHSARQHSLQRDVAVKTVKAELTAPHAAQAILREAVITGALEHPGIVPVHALGLDDRGAPVLVMKRIEGVEWRALIYDSEHPAWRGRPDDQLEAHLEILMHVCLAVHFAHSRGVIHRDLKPENVMVGDFGEAYLVDWGIAVRTDDAGATGMGLAGTPAYMAPEMVSGRRVTPRTDVYLLGATLHEVLTRSFLHQGITLQEVMLNAFCSEPFDYPPSVPDELAELCRRATARDPADRPESALAFRDELATFLRHRGAITLMRHAEERLHALQTMLRATPEDQPATDLRLAYQLVTEARFGFTQAQEAWPESEAASRGRAAAIAAQVDLELRQQHVESATALIAELGSPEPALLERVEAARRRVERKRAEEKRLHAMARDQDANVGSKHRTRGLAALAGAAVAITAFAFAQPSVANLRAESLLMFALFINAVVVAVTLLLRTQLLGNAFNRKIVGCMFVASGTLTLSRFMGLLYALPTSRIFVQDLLLLTCVCATTSALLLRWLWPMCGVLLAAVVVCMLLPAYAPHAFSVAGLITAPFGWFAIWMHGRHERALQAEALSRRASELS